MTGGLKDGWTIDWLVHAWIMEWLTGGLLDRLVDGWTDGWLIDWLIKTMVQQYTSTKAQKAQESIQRNISVFREEKKRKLENMTENFLDLLAREKRFLHTDKTYRGEILWHRHCVRQRELKQAVWIVTGHIQDAGLRCAHFRGDHCTTWCRAELQHEAGSQLWVTVISSLQSNVL